MKKHGKSNSNPISTNLCHDDINEGWKKEYYQEDNHSQCPDENKLSTGQMLQEIVNQIGKEIQWNDDEFEVDHYYLRLFSKTDDPLEKCMYTLPPNADDPQIVETHYKATISLMSQFVKYYRQVYKCLSNIRRTKNKKSYLIQIICITSKVLDKRCDADFKQFADALKWYNTLSDTTDTKISDTMGKLKSKVDEFKSSMFEIKVMMKYEQEESIYELSVLEGEN